MGGELIARSTERGVMPAHFGLDLGGGIVQHRGKVRHLMRLVGQRSDRARSCLGFTSYTGCHIRQTGGEVGQCRGCGLAGLHRYAAWRAAVCMVSDRIW